MTSEETRNIVFATARVVSSISHVAIAVCWVTCATLFAVTGLMYVTWRHDKALDRLAVLASDNYKKVLEFRAKQDAQDLIVVNYIQDTITLINKLQSDNSDPKQIQKRGLKVPKGVEIRLPNVPAPTLGDFERPLTPTPAPAPTPRAVEHKKKGRSPRRTPTPRPWYRFFPAR